MFWYLGGCVVGLEVLCLCCFFVCLVVLWCLRVCGGWCCCFGLFWGLWWILCVSLLFSSFCLFGWVLVHVGLCWVTVGGLFCWVRWLGRVWRFVFGAGRCGGGVWFVIWWGVSVECLFFLVLRLYLWGVGLGVWGLGVCTLLTVWGCVCFCLWFGAICCVWGLFG